MICGGPPCQGFSTIGKRVLEDPRNRLPREFIRVVRDLRPEYFLFENVPGLAAGAYGRILDEILSEFAEAGYSVSQPVSILSATDFGVPKPGKDFSNWRPMDTATRFEPEPVEKGAPIRRRGPSTGAIRDASPIARRPGSTPFRIGSGCMSRNGTVSGRSAIRSRLFWPVRSLRGS